MFYLFLRERETETEAQAGEGQRERETQNPKQTPDTELSAQSPMGLEFTSHEIMT